MPEIFEPLLTWMRAYGWQAGLVILITLVAAALARLVSNAIFHYIARDRDPDARKRITAIRGMLNIAITGAILLLGLISFLGILQIDFSTGIARTISQMILVIIIAVVSIRIVKFVSDWIFARIERDKDPEFCKRTTTLNTVVKTLLTVLVLVVGIIVILGLLEIDIAPILATFGIVGVAVGFGAQHLVKDIITGFFILLDDQIRAGDVVEIAGKAGFVEHVGLRIVRLRDYSGNVHFVHNGDITVVTNMTKEFSYRVFDIGIAYREDYDEVIEVIKQVAEELRADPEVGADILEPLEVAGLDAFGDSAVVIKVRLKTRPIRQWAVGRAFNRLLKKRFDELDIEIPFPHITFYAGQDKDGQAPPLNLRVHRPDDNAIAAPAENA